MLKQIKVACHLVEIHFCKRGYTKLVLQSNSINADFQQRETEYTPSGALMAQCLICVPIALIWILCDMDAQNKCLYLPFRQWGPNRYIPIPPVISIRWSLGGKSRSSSVRRLDWKPLYFFL